MKFFAAFWQLLHNPIVQCVLCVCVHVQTVEVQCALASFSNGQLVRTMKQCSV